MHQASEARYETMQYRRAGRSGLLLPAISLGLWHNFGGADVFESSRAMARRAFDLASPTSTWPTTTGRPRAARRKTLAAF